MADQKTIAVYDSEVEKYTNMLNQLPVDDLLLGFIARFKPNDFILDLGCGPAVSSATIREHGLKVDAIDASKEMIQFANSTFDINARVADFEDIGSKSNMKKEELYDGIWANFSLLHATHSEFSVLLNKLHSVLKSNGFLHLGMKVGQGSKRDKLGRYYSYYSQLELQQYLENAGFIIKQVILGSDVGLAGIEEPWIAMTNKA